MAPNSHVWPVAIEAYAREARLNPDDPHIMQDGQVLFRWLMRVISQCKELGWSVREILGGGDPAHHRNACDAKAYSCGLRSAASESLRYSPGLRQLSL